MERLSEIMPVRQIDNDYPIKRDSGHYKLTFSDFNSSLTYRFSRHSWPIIPIFDLFSLPIQESKYESFYITFINLAHATEPNTPLRDLQFIFGLTNHNLIFMRLSSFNLIFILIRIFLIC